MRTEPETVMDPVNFFFTRVLDSALVSVLIDGVPHPASVVD